MIWIVFASLKNTLVEFFLPFEDYFVLLKYTYFVNKLFNYIFPSLLLHSIQDFCRYVSFPFIKREKRRSSAFLSQKSEEKKYFNEMLFDE